MGKNFGVLGYFSGYGYILENVLKENNVLRVYMNLCSSISEMECIPLEIFQEHASSKLFSLTI